MKVVFDTQLTEIQLKYVVEFLNEIPVKSELERLSEDTALIRRVRLATEVNIRTFINDIQSVQNLDEPT